MPKLKTKQKQAKAERHVEEAPEADMKADKKADNKADKRAEKKAKKADSEKAAREKTSVEFESPIQRDEAVSYFETLVAGLKKGSIHLRQNEDELTLNPPAQLEVRVKASRKHEKEKISFEISWRTSASELSISAE